MNTYSVPFAEGDILRNKSLYITQVPGSKSITNRALLLASLSNGETTLRNVLFSDDSRHFLKCIQDMGIKVSSDENTGIVRIWGKGTALPAEASIYVGSAGTAARFLTAALGVSHGKYKLDSSEQMKRRPMLPLIRSLEELGCHVTFEEEYGHFPFTLEASGFGTDHISVNIDSSSQFLSALLIASVLSDKSLTIDVLGTHGQAYIDMTIKMMEQFGVNVNCSSKQYKIPAGQTYAPCDYTIEPDVSGAAYFYSLAPLLGVSVCVKGVKTDSLQGDLQYLYTLVKMGCSIEINDDKEIILLPPSDGIIHGTDIDMSSFSDQAITLACLAPFADSPTTIRGIGHIRLQESDRLSAMSTELTRLGIKVETGSDYITILPGNPVGTAIDTYDDHRMAMSFTLIGLKVPGVSINNPECCRKTFENYFEVIDSIFKAD